MVGPRVSEILHLHAGCVRRLVGDAAGAPVSVIVGSIFKRQPGYDGCPHEWVAPPVAVQAISVLEALSEPHRALTARPELWLRRRRGNGAWVARGAARTAGDRVAVARQPSAAALRRRLGLSHLDKPWRLTTHRGARPSPGLRRCATAAASSRWLSILAIASARRPTTVTSAATIGSTRRSTPRSSTSPSPRGEHMLAAPGPRRARGRRDRRQAPALSGAAA